MDALFVTPDSSAKAYQELAKVFSAIEPPTWSLLLAESCRSKGFDVGILDCDAERLTLKQSVQRIADAKPRLIVMVLYGQNPNSGTTSMIGAIALGKAIKDAGLSAPIVFVGSHTSALPREVLALECADIVLLNEGVYALHNLLASNLCGDLPTIKGIGYKGEAGANGPELILNAPERIVPQDRMDVDLPGYAWDLLPYGKRPLDLYRAHFWHAEFSHEKRTPFAAIYTSLGCQFACNFCMINIVNRVDNDDLVNASHSRGMRYWSPQWVMREMRKLAEMGVRTLRISDEMFFFNRRFYLPVLENCIEEEFGFNMWTYSRVDTVRPNVLETFKRAGVNWLALGVEAGNQMVRQEVSKGSFKEVNIREVCKTVQASDINIISNYIFGFPEDNLETMQETLDLALDLNTEMANMYPCQALPGSPMYHTALENDWDLPGSYEGYGFLSYEAEPLRTKHLTAAEVIKFRDDAWQTYFTNPDYLSLVEKRFGVVERSNVEAMTKIKLKRKLLGD
ncbi:MAG: radical SAM protein [Rhizobiaceae bacterium]|nr:radical SAM protein [Rhizobiaceae bacterium]